MDFPIRPDEIQTRQFRQSLIRRHLADDRRLATDCFRWIAEQSSDTQVREAWKAYVEELLEDQSLDCPTKKAASECLGFLNGDAYGLAELLLDSVRKETGCPDWQYMSVTTDGPVFGCGDIRLSYHRDAWSAEVFPTETPVRATGKSPTDALSELVFQIGLAADILEKDASEAMERRHVLLRQGGRVRKAVRNG